MVVITLPDGSKKEFENQVSCYDVARSISNSLAKNAVAAKVNGEVKELKSIIDGDADLVEVMVNGTTNAVEDSTVSIYGKLTDRYSYDTKSGGSNTVPAMVASSDDVTVQ